MTIFLDSFLAKSDIFRAFLGYFLKKNLKNLLRIKFFRIFAH